METTYSEVYLPPPRIVGRALVHHQPYEVTRVRTSLPPPPLQYYGPREEREQYVPNIPVSFHQAGASGNESVVPIYSAQGSSHDNNRYLEQFPGNITGLPPGHVRFYTPSIRHNHQRYESSVSQNGFRTMTSPQENRGGMEQLYPGASHTIPSGPNGEHAEQSYNGGNEAHSMTHHRFTENDWNNSDSRNSVPALGSMTLNTGELSTSLKTQEADKTYQNWHAATTEQQGQWGLQINEETASLNLGLYSEEFFGYLEKKLNYPVSSSAHQISPVSYNNQVPPPPLHLMVMHQQQQYEFGAPNHRYPGSCQQHQQMNMARAPQNIIRERHDQYFQPMVERNTDLRKLRNERRRSTRRPRDATSRFMEAMSHVYPPYGPQRGRGCSNQWSGGVVEVGYNMPEMSSSSGVENFSDGGSKNHDGTPVAIDVGEREMEASQSGNKFTMGQPETEQPTSTCAQQCNAPTLARVLDASYLNKIGGIQTQDGNPVAVDVVEGEVEAPSQSGNNTIMGQPETEPAPSTASQRSNAPLLARLLDTPCLNKAGGADKFESLLFAALAKVAHPGGEEEEVNFNAADVAPERRQPNRGKVIFEVDENIISDEEQGL